MLAHAYPSFFRGKTKIWIWLFIEELFNIVDFVVSYLIRTFLNNILKYLAYKRITYELQKESILLNFSHQDSVV